MIVVDVGAALQEDTFRRLFTSVDKEAKKQVEWKVKIERSLVATLKTMNDIRAFRACDVIAAYLFFFLSKFPFSIVFMIDHMPHI